MKKQGTKHRRRFQMPTAEEIRAIRKRIELRKVNLQTGSVCLFLDGEEFRLQKVNRGAKDRFFLAYEPVRYDNARKIALIDEAFEQFEKAKEDEAKEAKQERKAPVSALKIVDKRQLDLFPEPRTA